MDSKSSVKNESKKLTIITIATVMILVIIFAGVTYAFFTANNPKGSTAQIISKSGKMLITYEDGTSDILTSKDIMPSNEIIVNKTFTLTGSNTTSGLTMPYKVGIKYTSGFSNGQLHYYIKRTNTNGNVTSTLVGTADQTIPGNTTETGYTSETFIKGNRYIQLASGEFKAGTSNQTITFNLKIQFPDTGKNQDSEKGATFNGEVVVNYENETGVDYITKLYNEDKENNGLLMDNTKDANIRYSGSNPNNYVEFGNTGELWRIIGIFNVTDSNGITSQKLKIVKSEGIGSFSWDAKLNSQTNDYRGINDWTESDLMQELNGDYLNYNLTENKTNWFNSYWISSGPVSRQTGIFNYQYTIKEKYQQMISKSVWNIGGSAYNPNTNPVGLPTLGQYNSERGNVSIKNVRPITWIGKIGLIYPSDFGFASTNSECREELRAGQAYNVDTKTYDYTNLKCKNNNWLYKNTSYWTLSPFSGSYDGVWSIRTDASVYAYSAFGSFMVFPSTYLNSNMHIINGNGTIKYPYKLG